MIVRPSEVDDPSSIQLLQAWLGTGKEGRGRTIADMPLGQDKNSLSCTTLFGTENSNKVFWPEYIVEGKAVADSVAPDIWAIVLLGASAVVPTIANVKANENESKVFFMLII